MIRIFKFYYSNAKFGSWFSSKMKFYANIFLLSLEHVFYMSSSFLTFSPILYRKSTAEIILSSNQRGLYHIKHFVKLESDLCSNLSLADLAIWSLLSFFIYRMEIIYISTELLARVNQMKCFKQGHILNIQEIGSCCSYHIDLSFNSAMTTVLLKPVVLKQMF